MGFNGGDNYLGGLCKLKSRVLGVDLGACNLHEAHICSLGALGLVRIDDILAPAPARLLSLLALCVLGLRLLCRLARRCCLCCVQTPARTPKAG